MKNIFAVASIVITLVLLSKVKIDQGSLAARIEQKVRHHAGARQEGQHRLLSSGQFRI